MTVVLRTTLRAALSMTAFRHFLPIQNVPATILVARVIFLVQEHFKVDSHFSMPLKN